VIKAKYYFQQSLAFFTLVLALFVLGMFLLPFHRFYLRARIALYKALFQIVIAPFGKVKFRHFFLADILCSLTLPLRDIGISLTYFVTGNFLTS
jgi:xenotropic and polytropic retrovirus receptor 1